MDEERFLFKEKDKSCPSRSSSEYGRQHQHQSMIDTNHRSYLKNDSDRNNGVQFQ